MKVQIESTPTHSIHNAEPLIVLNGIIRSALMSKSLTELKTAIQYIDTYGFMVGFGANHCWVKQDNNGNRILLITENQ